MHSDYQHIKFRIEGRVARVTLARPPVNIFNIAMMGEIAAALNECSYHREIVAIVLAAAPDCRAFSTGVSVD